MLDPWTEAEWEEHVAEAPKSWADQSQGWLIALLMLVPAILVFSLGMGGAPRNFAIGLGMTFAFVCSTVAAWLAVRNSSEHLVVRTVTAGLLVIGLMVMQLGFFAFVGCCASID